MKRARLTRGALAPWSVAGLALLLVAVAALESHAQTAFYPYYGKNRVKYDHFEWHIYTTDHFEIYYYPELEQHLERVASYAESAYKQISADLEHDLAERIPLVVFKTHSEFEQQNIIPGEIPEGVLAFAEPQRDRMVLPIDEPPDQLYRLIAHELTHIFEFDIIPRSVIRQAVPLWVDEGLADYMAGVWRPLDLMTIRDAAVADIVPKMSEFEQYGGLANPRLVYNLGHAAFEFMESRWGKEGIRQYLFALRKNVIGGGGDSYEDALRLSDEEFDREFDQYIKDRFKPFRDKERPADYGRNLAPDPRTTRYPAVYSIEPSPSGDLIAAMASNRKDRELDIILISSQDGEVIDNLTSGFSLDYGFDYITTPGSRFNTVAWMSWSPVGDQIAYFVRREKKKTLILQNVVTGKIEERIEMTNVDEPESPDIGPTGRRVVLSALRDAIGDIFMVDLDTAEVTNLTNDAFADYAPTFSPDGTFIVYLARVSGNDKLFRLDLETLEKTQLTFGTHDDAVAQFIDDQTIVFSSTAIDPAQPIDPEVARNGNIFNIWTLDLRTGELQQYTDTLTGNVSPIVLHEDNATRLAFVTYFKGEYGVHTITREEPLYTAATSDFGDPGPIIDFQAPLTHTLIIDNSRKKGPFEKLFLEGRPPVNIGVTNSGDVLGGTQLTFTDVLGDQQFSFYAASISQYRTLALSYTNLSRRFQFAAQGFSQDQFFFGLGPGSFFDQAFGFLDRDDALAVRTVRGGSIYGIYPFSRYRRLTLSGSLFYNKERFDDPGLEQASREFEEQQFGTRIFRDGMFMPFGVVFTQETTIFREFGPVAGNTVRVGYEVAPPFGPSLSRQTFDADARYYFRLGETGLLALRARGFKSWGEYPDFLYFGGNSEMRGYDYLEFIGHEAFFMNAELRFPLIEAMLTPIGVLGGIRGVFFFNVGAAGFNDQPFKIYATTAEAVTPVEGREFVLDPQDPERVISREVFGDPVPVSGFRLVDGRAAYGIGLETFAIGFPVHFDWSWPTLFNKAWEDVLFADAGGSSVFRRSRFDFWIGYDF